MTAAKPIATAATFTVDAKRLTAQLALLLPVIGKETIPILKTVLVDVRDGKLALAASDCDIYMRTMIDVDVTGEWSGCIDLRLLHGIADKASGEIMFSAGEQLGIRNDSFSGALAVQPAESFPSPLVTTETNDVAVSVTILASALTKILPIVSDETYRNYATQGVCLSVSGSQVEIDATDGFRVSVAGHVDDAALAVLVPRKAAQVLSRLLTKADSDAVLRVGATDNLIGFTFGDVSIITRKLAGQFPPFAKLIAQTVVPDIITLNKVELLAAIGRTAFLCADPNEWQRWEIEPGKLTIGGQKKTDGSEGRVEIAIEYNGAPVVIGLKPMQIDQGVRCIEGETLTLSFDASKPGSEPHVLFKAPGYTYMICVIQARFL